MLWVDRVALERIVRVERKATISELSSVVCPRCWLLNDPGDIIIGFFCTNWYIPIDNVCLFIRYNERIKASMRSMRDSS